MQNITAQQFAAMDQVCCRTVSFFNMAMHHYVIGLLDSWDRNVLGIATAFALQFRLSFKWFFVCLDHTTNHLEKWSLRTMKMFNSMCLKILTWCQQKL